MEEHRVARRARDIARLTGLSLWRGFEGFYNSDNLTYAASIAYYALLSLFPFFLLALAVLSRTTDDVSNRNEVLTFVLRFFPAQFDFITSSSTPSATGRSPSAWPERLR